MNNILANDGLDKSAVEMLTANGFTVNTHKIPQEELPNKIHDYDVVVVRSATKIRKPELDAATKLKLVVRGGVGIDNIDAVYAESKGIKVRNTPMASTQSVAEMVFTHLFSGVRFLTQSNREMNAGGTFKFNQLKKDFSKGIELKGKTLGILGFGNIGIAVARTALGLGMKVVAYDLYPKTAGVKLDFAEGKSVTIDITTISKEEVIAQSDFISVNASGKDEALNKTDFEKMKHGVGIINCARGGMVNETDLLEYLNSGKISFAGLDVFKNEPTPREDLLSHPRISLSPHIAASTLEGQERVGLEVAQIIIDFFGK